MPIYEYRCNDCGQDFEYQQRMSDDPKTVCESCGGSLEKLISRSSFHLKGGGWYKDLYSSPKKNESAPSSGDAATSSSESKDSPAPASSSSGGGDGGGSGASGGGDTSTSASASSASTSSGSTSSGSSDG